MRRRLFNLLAAVSLVVCLATCGLWVDQRRNTRYASLNWPVAGPPTPRYPLPIDFLGYQRTISVGSGDEGLSIGLSNSVFTRTNPFRRFDGGSTPHVPPPPRLVAAGYNAYWVATWTARIQGWVGPHYVLHVRHWVVGGALLVLPVAGVVRAVRLRRSARRAAAGCCPACGYDLRATPARCPECGAVVG